MRHTEIYLWVCVCGCVGVCVWGVCVCVWVGVWGRGGVCVCVWGVGVCVCVFCNDWDMHMILTYALISYSYKSKTKSFGSYQLLSFSKILRVSCQKKKKEKKKKRNEKEKKAFSLGLSIPRSIFMYLGLTSIFMVWLKKKMGSLGPRHWMKVWFLTLMKMLWWYQTQSEVVLFEIKEGL